MLSGAMTATQRLHKKTILLVDDERTFVDVLSQSLSNEFEVLTAYNGLEAVETLNKYNGEIDLLITDLKMPEMDGFQLLAYISRNMSKLPVIVITAYGTPDMLARLEKYSSIDYIEKPIDFDELRQKIHETLENVTQGYLIGISLPSFLQLIEMEQKTCTIIAHSSGKVGRLYLLDGQLVHAELNGTKGVEAAYQIIAWENPEIEILNTCNKTKRTINQPLHAIIMEAMRLKDENAFNTEEYHKANNQSMVIDAGEIAFTLEEMIEDAISSTSKDSTQQQYEYEIDYQALNEVLNSIKQIEGVQKTFVCDVKCNVLFNELTEQELNAAKSLFGISQKCTESVENLKHLHSITLMTNKKRLVMSCNGKFLIGCIGEQSMPVPLARMVLDETLSNLDKIVKF